MFKSENVGNVSSPAFCERYSKTTYGEHFLKLERTENVR